MTDCPSINERAALNQAITTAMDMTRAGIAQSKPEWRVVAEKWFDENSGMSYPIFLAANGVYRFKAESQDAAQWLADKLNGKA